MKDKILIIPGNPSVKHYYELWAKRLSESSSFKVKVLHHIPVTNAYKTLDEYTNAYEQFVLSQIDHTTKPILIGHSIGGFFAREILKRNKDKFKNLILVFPYFGDENLQGLALLSLTKILAPRPLLRNKSLNFLLKLSCLRDISFSELDNGVKLGSLEREYFKNNSYNLRSEDLLDSRTDFLYTEKDNWCTLKTVLKIKSLKIKSHKLDSAHDFVLNESDINKVNQRILEILKLD